MDSEQRAIIGNEARQLLENKHLREAFIAVNERLDEMAMACDPDNKEKAARIIISKQLLAAIKREIERKVEDGEMAQVELSEIERKRWNLKFYR